MGWPQASCPRPCPRLRPLQRLGTASSPTPASISSPPPGDRYWLFREANLEPGYPQPLVTYGQGIPYDGVDTAIWWEPTGHTFFFRGDR